MLEENKAKGSTENKEEGTVKKKKLAVVFHSQNSVNHKNHPLSGKFSDKAKKAKEQEKKEDEKRGNQEKEKRGRSQENCHRKGRETQKELALLKVQYV